MSNFGELVLVVGDFHIPTRATKIPAPFKRMLVPNKMQHIICTGNLSSDTYEELRALAPNLHVAKGDWDMNTSFPETRVVQVGGFRIGVVHGHQVLPHSTDALSILRRKLNVDILVSGHTHQSDVTIHEDQYYFINPVRSVHAEEWVVLCLSICSSCLAFPGINNRRLFVHDCIGDSILYFVGRSRQ